ncbi:hypothetical protein NDU88_001626 [Pleurodeles waltl]|uniref:Uncharacterized protein n=1 Tax=Pleurodeles waltl TaxID=8319 RepID=A0AAV7LD56_PLEWA|nr:hypothetical protein NDU88_001626 [Pleurodeles waltl]
MPAELRAPSETALPDNLGQPRTSTETLPDGPRTPKNEWMPNRIRGHAHRERCTGKPGEDRGRQCIGNAEERRRPAPATVLRSDRLEKPDQKEGGCRTRRGLTLEHWLPNAD